MTQQKLFLLILISFTQLPLLWAQSHTETTIKHSPRTQLFLASSEKNMHWNEYVCNKIDGKIYLSAMAKVRSNIAESDLQQRGVFIGTKAGKIWTLQIPLAQMKYISSVKGIEYLELDEPISFNLDSATKVTRADSAHKGINLPIPYSGKDVIVGIVDVGFDYTHPTLYDSTGTTYRVKRVWEQHKTGTPPTSFAYGNEIADSLSMFAAQTDNSSNTHGMHVAGITSGSGRKSSATSNSKFQGMAFESDVVLVGIMPDSLEWKNTGVSSIVDAIHYIYNYAATVGKPAVVNLSWGPPLGPRDGTSLFSQAVDALTGKGKIFVCSAGNNGDVNLHIKKTFTSADTAVSTFVTFASYLNTKNTWVDIWGETGQSFCVKASLYNGTEVSSTNFVCLDNALHRFPLIGTNNDTCFVDIVTSTAEFNGKPRVYISFGSKVNDSICLTVKGTNGDINIWNGYVRDATGYYGDLTSYGKSWATPGDADYTTSDFVATNSAIGVGAYSSRITFKNISNLSQSYSSYTSLRKLVPFSSHGPTANGRIVPEITAPGLAVISSVSSFNADYKPGGSSYSSVISRGYDSLNSKYYYYAQMSGTSMSSPAASGIVALMLQANPNLTPSQTKTILANTAITDTFTGQLPAGGTSLWGHGKINAYQAVMEALLLPSEISEKKQLFNADLYPSANHGHFSISISNASLGAIDMLIFDAMGKQVFETKWNKTSESTTKAFDIPSLSIGIYYVQLQSGANRCYKKMLIE